MFSRNGRSGFLAIAVVFSAPIAHASVFDSLHAVCKLPSNQVHASCDGVSPSDPKFAACAVAIGNADASTAACNADVNAAESTFNTVVSTVGATKVGYGEKQFCGNGGKCIASAIAVVYTPVVGHTVAVCAAAAPGAISTTVECDGVGITAPSPDAAVGYQPNGGLDGCVGGRAYFLETNLTQVNEDAVACAKPVP